LYGDFGWQDTIYDINIDENDIHIPTDTYIPIGKYKTLAIIQHRNKILNSFGLNIPEKTENSTELDRLNNLLKVNGCEQGQNGSMQYLYYYPVASACYAYEPKVSGLDDKFKSHTWWLPTSGEILRLLYYLKNNKEEFAHVIADKKFNLNKINQYSSTSLWSSSEVSREEACRVAWSSRAYPTQDKVSMGAGVRPINKF
jgi:hypothetical protein